MFIRWTASHGGTKPPLAQENPVPCIDGLGAQGARSSFFSPGRVWKESYSQRKTENCFSFVSHHGQQEWSLTNNNQWITICGKRKRLHCLPSLRVAFSALQLQLNNGFQGTKQLVPPTPPPPALTVSTQYHSCWNIAFRSYWWVSIRPTLVEGGCNLFFCPYLFLVTQGTFPGDEIQDQDEHKSTLEHSFLFFKSIFSGLCNGTRFPV